METWTTKTKTKPARWLAEGGLVITEDDAAAMCRTSNRVPSDVHRCHVAPIRHPASGELGGLSVERVVSEGIGS